MMFRDLFYIVLWDPMYVYCCLQLCTWLPEHVGKHPREQLHCLRDSNMCKVYVFSGVLFYSIRFFLGYLEKYI